MQLAGESPWDACLLAGGRRADLRYRISRVVSITDIASSTSGSSRSPGSRDHMLSRG
jgi:hypothetical protein